MDGWCNGSADVPAVAPPSTRSTAPVTKPASVPASQTTAAAISSGRPGRPVGLTDTAAAYSSVTGLTGLSTSTNPGETALTRIPRSANSTAQALVAISSAAFDVQ
jgi:hypothetical protein